MRKYSSFTEARKFACSLKLTSRTDWENYRKSNRMPDDIPTNPNLSYKNDGWKSMGDWLGTEKIANVNRQFRPFEEAKEVVHSLGLKTAREWKEYCNSEEMPNDIPR